METILKTIKNDLGIEEDRHEFDAEIVTHVNSTLMILNQLDVGPREGFVITGKEEAAENETWDSFLGGRKDLEAVKSYIHAKVRLLFDPPQMGYLVESLKSFCSEFEWRLNVQAEEVKEAE